MEQWRNTNPEGIDNVWRKLSENLGRSTEEVQSAGEQERSIQMKMSGVEDGPEDQKISASQMK